ncbi:unnamed protein product [Durusdinium trenchii]|uniref:Uncharacterized protein n=1 Tax=Durusdinium trenchii TaxID=1381693 RepID=A0ABP0T0K5_9DINO
MVHKVGVATVLGGACVLAGLFHWSNLALTPRLQVKRCSTKSPREVEGLSLAKLEGLAQDLERRYIQTGKLKGGVLAVVRAGKVVGIWEFGEYNSETVFKFFSISKDRRSVTSARHLSMVPTRLCFTNCILWTQVM